MVATDNKHKNILFIVFVCFFVGLIALCIFLSPKESLYKNTIKNDNQIAGLSVVNNDELYTIKYLINDGKTEEYFKIKADEININNIGNHNYSPFFSCSERNNNKIIYIILDVSGSVIDNYSTDRTIEKIQTILGDNIKPGDQVRIRFLGSKDDNDNEYNIDFIGPSFTYEISKNTRLKENKLNLLNYSEGKTPPNCNNINAATSIWGLIKEIKSEYNQRKEKKDNYTNIVYTLEKITEEVKINNIGFSSIMYILFTDGIQTDGGYDSCDINSAEECGLSIRGLRSDTDENKDEVIVIGIKSSELKKIFTKLFYNIKISFQ
jgi:hypothetical protein